MSTPACPPTRAAVTAGRARAVIDTGTLNLARADAEAEEGAEKLASGRVRLKPRLTPHPLLYTSQHSSRGKEGNPLLLSNCSVPALAGARS